MKKLTLAMTSLFAVLSLSAFGLVMPATGDNRVTDPAGVAQIVKSKSTTADVKKLHNKAANERSLL